MNRLAVVEDQVGLFLEVSEKLASKLKAPIPAEVKIAVYTLVNNWMMNDTINTQKNQRYEKKQTQQDEPPSPAQIRYAEDLGIEIPQGCTKKTLSNLIKQKVG